MIIKLIGSGGVIIADNITVTMIASLLNLLKKNDKTFVLKTLCMSYMMS